MQSFLESRLGRLCDLSTGYTARGRMEIAKTGGSLAIQMRDVQADIDLGVDQLDRFALDDLPERYMVRGGEVIFRSRGAPNTAAVVSRGLPEPVAIILPLVILRPNVEMVLPDYLAWVINQPQAQRYFDSEAQGTNMRMIPKAVLERLEVPLPDLETQSLIVSVHKLAKREGALLRDLAERREQLSSIILAERARAGRKKELVQ
ncbi:restriction endonuclease subunit S [Cognatishimia sp. F0-27]|nr:restriction endonuclease subunit S [Cognatishimia sp. F0-27]